MSAAVFEKKAYFIGTWKDDAVSDNIIKQIATLTTLEKGRKVKLKLTPEGLRITKSNMFLMKTLFDYIPLYDIFFMTINQQHPMCLMCVIRDPDHKYTIIAFRCASELIAGTFVQNFRAWKKTAGQENVEFRKKDDGNWTLRERSNANARRELQQLFNSEPTQDVKPQLTGGIFYKKSEKRNSDERKTNIYEQTPYAPMNGVKTEVYTEGYTTSGQVIHNSVPKAVVRDDDSMSQISDISTMKGEMEALSSELKEVKYLLERSTGMTTREHYMRAGIAPAVTNNNETYAVNYNKYKEPIVVDRRSSSNSSVVAKVDVPDHRNYGSQTFKTTTTVHHDGPEHLIAKSYRNSGELEPDADKGRYRVHSVSKGDVEMRRAPHSAKPDVEYSVARHSNGFKAEDGIVYAAQKEANVSTVAYPAATLPATRSRVNSMSSTVVSGHPGYAYGTKSSTLKFRPTYSGVPSVVQRPIEDIYAKPVLIRRDYIVSRRRRPHTMYVNIPREEHVYSSQVIRGDM
ncbi:hypothetical protein LOTGIDRAFT_168532 [Lottia gigantea]|uniref:PID domain-containing protein n=1 Tax=Lottia gigantea TaxID=225164 RepID=V3ZK83_LOTGI|nr:hypothetical protein LOTGIDRAFT_168532 [Lottia gigantea]ESO84667.1 hypothetical protein LOTGIDRAFT_168532 [Lottia gigantea]